MSTEALHKETRELILRNIEKRDRRFRLFQGAFVVAIFLTLLGLLWVQEATLDNVKKELTQQQETVKEIKKNNDTINRHLDCIIVYFGQKNRSDLTIQDINKCTLQNNTGVQQFFAPNSGTTNGDQTQLSPNSTQTSPQSTTTTPTPSNSQPAAQTTPTPAPNPNPQPAPKEVLGIPLCVPFTGVCAR